MTPCGSFIFCGSAEGRVCVWRTEDGQKAAEFLDHMDAQLPVLCVEYHPLDHYLVVSQFGEGARLFVYEHDSSGIGAYLSGQSTKFNTRKFLLNIFKCIL